MIKLIGNPVSYLYHYFNLFHCLLVCPYTFVYNRKLESYKLQTSCLIQILSFIITLFSFYNPIKKFYVSIFDHAIGVHPLMNLLDLVKAVSECIYVLAISYTLWFKKSQLYEIVHLLHAPEWIFKYSFEIPNCKAKIYCAVITLIVSATVTLNTIELWDSWNLATIEQQKILDETVSSVLLRGHQLLSTRRPNTLNYYLSQWPNTNTNNSSVSSNVFLNVASTTATTTTTMNINNNNYINESTGDGDDDDDIILTTSTEFSFYKIFVMILYFFENNFVQLVYCFGDWLMIIISLVLREAVNRFEQIVNDSNSTTAQVLDYYEALKTLSRKINQAFSLLVFAFTVGSIPLFVTSLLTVMNPKSPVVLTRDLIYFFNFFYFLFMAVFIDKKSTTLEKWLLIPKNYNQLSTLQMNVLLHEMKTREIGFHGLGLFKVSAGLLGMTINLILTFSIIFLQFNTTRSTTVEFEMT